MLAGLRHLMYRHPWFSAFLGVSSNILILTTIILVSWARFLQPEESDSAKNTSEAENITEPTADVKPEASKDSIAENEPEVPEPEASTEVISTTESSPPNVKTSICNRLMWFLLKAVFKFLWKSTKLVVCVALFVVSYEAIIHGVDKPELLVDATKEDMVYIATYLGEKSLVFVEILKNKFM